MNRRLGRLANILGREMPLWLIDLLTGWLPEIAPVCRLRGTLSRPFFRRCGRNFQYARHVKFLKPENISIGDDVYFASGCWISGSMGLTVEDQVMFGPYALVVTANHAMVNGSARFSKGVGGPVRIGRGAWIGAHGVVLPGVAIGAGSIVGANAVVTRDVPDNTLAGGIPAKAIRQLDADPA